MRYLAELASRAHRRTLSSYIEWAIEASFSQVLPSPSNPHVTLGDEASALWDVDEPDRFATLASRYPDLLTHEEQRRWKLIRENGYLWRGRYVEESGKRIFRWDPNKISSLIVDRLREYWNTFVSVARDEAPPSAMPSWSKPQPAPAVDADDDDDLPF
jgi:hypothetical protein